MNKKLLGLKIYEWIVLLLIIFIIIYMFLIKDKVNLETHCQKAVCNEDLSVCYDYVIDHDGKTKTVWSGSCKSTSK